MSQWEKVGQLQSELVSVLILVLVLVVDKDGESWWRRSATMPRVRPQRGYGPEITPDAERFCRLVRERRVRLRRSVR